MKSNTIIIQASARSQGDTQKIVAELQAKTKADHLDLLDYNIGHFQYDFAHADDDFIPLMDRLTQQYDQLIFVSPIYWYTMSGHLKVFMDRLSDLLKTHKEIGRRLRGKTLGIISVSNDNDRKDGFEMPFKESAAYLGMNYITSQHTWVQNDEIPEKVRQIIQRYGANLTHKKTL